MIVLKHFNKNLNLVMFLRWLLEWDITIMSQEWVSVDLPIIKGGPNFGVFEI